MQVYENVKKIIKRMGYIDMAEYTKYAEREGMTKRLRIGEYGVSRTGTIIVRYEGSVWGGNNHYEVFPPIGYSWETCSSGGVHGWNEATLSEAREHDIVDANPCDGDGDCFWGAWIYEPEKHHPIELMYESHAIGAFNPFFS